MAANQRSSSSSSRSSTSSQASSTLDVEAALQELMDIDGAVGGAIVDYENGMTLGTIGGRNLDMELAGAGNTEVLRSKKNILHDLGIDERMEDILISLESHYHLLRVCESHEDVFMYLVIDRSQGNLGLARRSIDQIDEVLEI
jgi:predicted regulator of Ras-like GTPase activity (Roadblock/LC7/MglB family)